MKTIDIKNVLTYKAALPHHEALAEHLKEQVHTPIGDLEYSKSGFEVNPITEKLVSPFSGGLSFRFRFDEKIIPAAVIKQEVDNRAASVEQDTGKPANRKLRAAIKNSVIEEMLPVALVRTTIINAWYHTQSQRLFVATASEKLANALMSKVIKAVGSVKTETTHVCNVKHGLTTRMQAHIMDNEQAFGGFLFGDGVWMSRGHEKINYQGVEDFQQCEEVAHKLGSGFEVDAVKMSWEGHIDFKLTGNFQFKQIKWDSAHFSDAEDAATAWMAEAFYKVSALNRISETLLSLLEYKEEEQSAA